MPHIQTSQPGALAVNLIDLKNHLRLTTSDEDPLLTLYLRAATATVESKTRRVLVSRTYRLELEEFPGADEIILPVGPVSTVASVQYRDRGGDLQTLDPEKYFLDVTPTLGRVVRKEGVTWPDTQVNRPDGVRVSFTAGYGSSYMAIPEALRFVVMLMASHFYTNRVPVDVGGSAGQEIPLLLCYAMDSYKILSL
jgi:uncharacterized phiE125 gp8 family phage protein